MKVNIDNLPDFDLLIGGFPCQTFSINGDRFGLDDFDREQVIYGLAKIIKKYNIKYFILENVKGLTNHNKGHTFKVVLRLLECIGYSLYYKILNSINFVVPQMRERIYIIGIRNYLIDKSSNVSYQFPKSKNMITT